MANSRNIYQIARESKGVTQERAAELLDISVESIRAYEGGRRVPPDQTVLKMIEIYDTQHLAYQHLKTADEIGRKYIPKIEIKDLPSAILKLQKEMTDFVNCRDELVDITYDGHITEDEMPRYKEILKELDDICEAILALKCSKKQTERKE